LFRVNKRTTALQLRIKKGDDFGEIGRIKEITTEEEDRMLKKMKAEFKRMQADIVCYSNLRCDNKFIKKNLF